ncbi:hypothetical protein FPOA_12856 [Fusarium poae]|uniref:Methyltransferase type 11 domain-containing protein n=1 Tax=Fusarium poae TaxID=36050 RepID=A0A1B8A7T8_FUSPO|nr:hypothetical protein FPOA_12856 [Fusarium poae]
MTQNIYDNAKFFAEYSALDRSIKGLDGAPEWPRLRSYIPDLQGLDVLDLGCGFGWFARWARSTGANSVRGIEISKNMISQARARTNDTKIIYEQADLDNTKLSEDGSKIYDIVFSSLTLHYLVNLSELIQQVQTVLKPGGTFIFSIEHPIYTAPSKAEFITDVSGREYWPLDSYQKEGLRVTDWLAEGVQKQHRTIASYVNLLLKTGFQIVEFDEWYPTPEEMEKCDYIPEEYIANKNRKGRRSWIQAYGFFLTEVSPDLQTLQTYWACSKCDERGKSSLFVATNTTSPIEHLRRSHMITEADGNAYEEDSSRADSQPPSKRRCLELPTARSNVNKAKELTVGWIVTANLPFTALSNPYLRRMLDLHDASLAKEVPWSRQSVRDTMRKLFEVKKGAISCQLEKAVTKISFSFDMWTSPNRYAFLGLHAHYLDASYQVQSRLLALRRVWGAHSGDNQATTIYDIFGEYGIRDRIGAVRAFIWGEDPDSFEREAFTEAAFQVEERELRLWRKRGAVGKLHNIVRFVRASPQRRELMKSLACSQRDEDDYHLFEEDRAAIDLELMQNNETRWNSTFMMIQRAIRKREQIDHFITDPDTKASEPRQRITMRCPGWAKEGRYGALWQVMVGMGYLLNFFEEQKLIFLPPDGTADELQIARASATTRCSPPRADQGRGREKHLPQHTRGEYTGAFSQAESLDDDHRRRIQISINNCWSKLDEYYSLLGQSSLYPAAVILHPRWNVSWLEANWTSHEQLVWLRDAKNSVREFFEQQYPRKEQYEAARAMTGKAMRQDEPSQFDQWMQSYDQYIMEEEDEIGVYMRQGPVWRENLNPILWWKEH